jgi:hypothetical protein
MGNIERSIVNTDTGRSMGIGELYNKQDGRRRHWLVEEKSLNTKRLMVGIKNDKQK